MSDSTEEPQDAAGQSAREAHENAWEEACAEDLAAERAARRVEAGHGPAAEEFLKLVDAVGDKLAGMRSPLLGALGQSVVQGTAQEAARQAARQAVQQARTVVDPVVERNPQVFGHLAAAGSELLAAYRAAVTGQEARWTRREDAATRPGGADRTSDRGAEGSAVGGAAQREEGPGGPGGSDPSEDAGTGGATGTSGVRGEFGAGANRAKGHRSGSGNSAPGEHIDLD